MQIGVSVSIPASLSVRDDLECGQRAEHAVEFAAGRLRIEVRTEANGRL